MTTGGEQSGDGMAERLARLESRAEATDRLADVSNANHTERISSLERDNAELRGGLSKANGRVDRMFYWILGLGGAALLLLVRLSFE